MCYWFKDWLLAWLGVWLTVWMTDRRLTDRPTDRPTDQLSNLKTGEVNEIVMERANGQLDELVTDLQKNNRNDQWIELI